MHKLIQIQSMEIIKELTTTAKVEHNNLKYKDKSHA